MRGRRLPGTMGRRRSPRRTSVPSTARRAPAPTAAAARRSLAGAHRRWRSASRASRAAARSAFFCACWKERACPPPPAAAPRRRRRRAAHAARAAAAAAAAAARPRLTKLPSAGRAGPRCGAAAAAAAAAAAMAAAAAGVTAAIGAVKHLCLAQRRHLLERRQREVAALVHLAAQAGIAVRGAAGDGEVESASAVKQTVASATIVEITLVHFTARLHSVKLAPAFSSSRRAGRE